MSWESIELTFSDVMELQCYLFIFPSLHCNTDSEKMHVSLVSIINNLVIQLLLFIFFFSTFCNKLLLLLLLKRYSSTHTHIAHDANFWCTTTTASYSKKKVVVVVVRVCAINMEVNASATCNFLQLYIPTLIESISK